MRSNNGDGRLIATSAFCLALMAPVVHAGIAFAQAAAPRPQWSDRSFASSHAAYAFSTATRTSPANVEAAVDSAAPPAKVGPPTGESESGFATWIERRLRSIATPGPAEGSDVYFLVVAVAVYLASLLLADHLKAGLTDRDAPRDRIDVAAAGEEAEQDQGPTAVVRARGDDVDEATNRSRPR